MRHEPYYGRGMLLMICMGRTALDAAMVVCKGPCFTHVDKCTRLLIRLRCARLSALCCVSTAYAGAHWAHPIITWFIHGC